VQTFDEDFNFANFNFDEEHFRIIILLPYHRLGELSAENKNVICEAIYVISKQYVWAL